MKRLLLIIIISTLVVAAAYASVRGYTGQILDREFSQLSSALNEQPDLAVNRLDYEPGLFNGRLHYDVSVKLPDSHPMLDMIRLATNNQLPREVQLAGVADVGQGPFWSDGQWALARLRHDWYLPETWQQYLPDSASGPWLSAEADIAPDGSMMGTLIGQDYDGDWVNDNGVNLNLLLQGLHGVFTVDTMQQRVAMTAQADRARLSDGAFFGDAEQLLLGMTMQINDANDWSHQTDFMALNMETGSDVSGTLLSNLSASVELSQIGQRVDNRLEVSFDDSLIEAVPLQGGHIRLNLENLDAESYLALAEQLALGAGAPITPQSRAAMMDSLAELLARGPRIHIERFGVSLRETDDLTGALMLRYPEDAPVNLQQPTQLLQHLETDLSLIVTLGALREITHLLAEQEARELWRTRGIDRTEEQISRSALTRYRSTLVSFQLVPFIHVAEGKAETHLTLREGTVYQNGESVMPLGQMLQMFGL